MTARRIQAILWAGATALLGVAVGVVVLVILEAYRSSR